LEVQSVDLYGKHEVTTFMRLL